MELLGGNRSACPCPRTPAAGLYRGVGSSPLKPGCDRSSPLRLPLPFFFLESQTLPGGSGDGAADRVGGGPWREVLVHPSSSIAQRRLARGGMPGPLGGTAASRKNKTRRSEARRLPRRAGFPTRSRGQAGTEGPRRKGKKSLGERGERASPGRGNSFAMLINKRLIKTAL